VLITPPKSGGGFTFGDSPHDPYPAHLEAALGKQNASQLWLHSWKEKKVCWGDIEWIGWMGDCLVAFRLDAGCPVLAVPSRLPCLSNNILTVLSKQSCSSCLFLLYLSLWLSRSGYPVLAVLFCCPFLAVLSFLSCPGYPALAILPWLSYPGSHVWMFYIYLYICTHII
jgi:hypothetical protein